MEAVNNIKMTSADGCFLRNKSNLINLRKLLAVMSVAFFFYQTVPAQTGPGGIGSADGSSALKLWLRSDKNVSYDNLKNVISWTDFSGNGHVLTGSGTSPLFAGNSLNLMPAVNFSSDVAGLIKAGITGSSLFSSTGNTIFFVKKSQSGAYFFNWQSTVNNQVSLALSGNKEVFNFSDNTTGSLSTASDISGSWHILSNITDGANQRIFLDGSQDATKANSLSLNTASSASLFLGTYDGTSTNGWTGYIAEIILFNTNLNSASRTIVENYLSAKYNLPVNNDRYAGDQSGNGNYDHDVAGIGAESDGKNSGANSSGLYLKEIAADPLVAGSYLISGHAGALRQFSSADLPSTEYLRWNRSWYIDKTGTVKARISFDLSEGVDGGIPGDPAGYVLLYRPSNSGNFGIVTCTAAAVENTDQIYFDVENTNLNDGYYTLGSTSPNNSPLEGIKTWYNYSVGDADDWDNWERWTLDPDGSLLINPNHLTPGASDDVIILSGGTINITDVDAKAASSIEIKNGASLVISATAPKPVFGVIKGEGTIKVSGNKYPGDGSNDADFKSKGTVEYNGDNYSLTSDLTYYNLVINLSSGAGMITLKNNLTVTKDLTIQKGIFRINDNSNNVKYIINVTGDVVIPDTNGQIATGGGDPTGGAYSYSGTLPASGHFHDVYHELNISGDFINHGTARFTNLSAPRYNNFATDGAVTVKFAGEGNNSVSLYGPTYFYNLIIDKGSQDFVTTLYSASTTNFNLFGGNSIAINTTHPFTTADPEVRKALFIKSGTLKLTGDLLLHSLTEGNTAGIDDYYIGSNSCLWLDGSAVAVYSTANSSAQAPSGAVGVNTSSADQGISVLGKLRITNGNFGTHNSSGITFTNIVTGTLLVEGGTLDVSQIHSTTGGNGKAIFIQTGGDITIRGDQTEAGYIDTTFPLFGLVNTEDNIRISAGNIYIKDISSASGYNSNSFYINTDQNNDDITGGKITIDVNGSTSRFYSIASLWDLELHSLNNSNVTIQLYADLYVNDLMINNYTTLDMITANEERVLSVSGDLTIGTSTDQFYDYVLTGNNGTPVTTIKFAGSGNSDLIINNTYPDIFDPYNLVINKDNSNDIVRVSFIDDPPTDALINIKNDFTVSRGKFDYGDYIIDVEGDLENYGVMGVWNRGGRIRLNKASVQQTVIAGSGSDVLFGHIQVVHTDGSASNVQFNSNASLDLLTLTSGRIYIQNYKLSVDTNYVTYTAPGTPSNRMIYTANDHANRGLQLKMDYNYVNSTVTFPVGTFDGTNYRWGKCDVSIGAIGNIVGGYLTVAPVPIAHPSQGGGGCSILNYYWKTVAIGLSSVTNNVAYAFSTPLPDPGSTKEYYLINNVWQFADNYSSILTFSSANLHGFASGEFTAGKNGCFNQIKYVYSNGTGGGNWSVGSTWQGGAAPATYDIAVIRSQDSVVANANNQSAGMLYIRAGGVLDAGIRTGLSYGIIQGGGKFRIASNSATTPTLPAGDFDPFLLNDTAIFEYYGTGNYTLPTTPDYYPTLKVGGGTNSVKRLPNRKITVNHDLLVYDDDNTGVILTMSQSSTSGYDLLVKGSIKIFNQGVFRFPASGYARIVTVENSIDLAPYNDVSSNKIQIEDAAGSYSAFHTLNVKGSINLNSASAITLFRNTSDRRAVDLYFYGDINSEITCASGTVEPVFNTLNIDKDLVTNLVTISTDASFTTASVQPVVISGGHLILNSPDLNITLTSGSIGSFTIPQNGKLSLRNGSIANITGTSNGLKLDGGLSVENSSHMIIGTGTDNSFIEYGSSGNSSLSVSGTALLEVASQIRRKTSSESGSLNYSQTGGTVVVGMHSAPVPSRAVFEVMNTGAFTYTGGSLTIARSQSTAIPAVYIAPASYSLSSGIDITFGYSSTPAGTEIGLYSSIPLEDIVLSNAGGSMTVKSYSPGLTINSLLIGSGQEFNAAGNDLYLGGDFNSSGTYNPGDNTTFLSGSDQDITFTGSGNKFNNLTINSTGTVSLQSEILVENDLNIVKGTLSDFSNTINVQGNYLNSGTQYSEANDAGGVMLNGSIRQKISGSGIFGRISIDNVNGAEILNDFSLVDRNIYMINGSLFIRQYRLQLGQTAGIIAVGAGFSKDKMIVTNGSLSDKGIERAFNGAAVTGFTIPLGVNGKYSPVTLSQVTAVGNGFFEVRPVNQYHPTVLDPANVLGYYWNAQVTGFISFNGKISFSYNESDVNTSAPSVESDYIPAYLNGESWAKYDSKDINAISNIIEFNLTSSPSGDFTAGISSAIPNTIPVFYTIADGSWDDNIWAREGGGPVVIPNGYIVKIRTNVSIESNIKNAYKTIIESTGSLTIGETIGHYLGEVSGEGTLSIASSRLPAGTYDNFFSCTGGTMEYTGTDSYELPQSGRTYKNLKISGAGIKSLPDYDITICGNLEIDGPVLDNSKHNRMIALNGNLNILDGSFQSGTGAGATLVLSGSTSQSVTGTSAAILLNNVTVNNSGGVVLNNDVTISGQLTLTNGRITSTGYLLKLELSSSVSPAGGSALSYIDGPLTKVLSSGSSFTFPIGKGLRYGPFGFTNTSTSGYVAWKAEYFSTGNPYSATNVSQEYWIVTPPAGSSPVTLRWDNQSDINGLSAGDMANIRLVRYTGGAWQIQNGSVNAGSTNTNGSITSTSAITFSNGVAAYFALSSVVNLLPSATFITSNLTICRGESVDIQVGLANGTNLTLYYSVDGAPSVNEPVTTPLFVKHLTPANTTTYTLTGIMDGATSGNASGSLTITVNDVPSLIITDPSPACAPATVNLTHTNVTNGSSPGLTYSYWLDAAATQSYTNAATATTGTYYIRGVNSYGCYDIKDVNALINSPALVITNPSPVCYPTTVDITLSGITSGSSGIESLSYWTDVAATNSYLTPSSSTGGTYYIKGTDAGGCYDIKPVVVTINPLPSATISYSGSPWCPNAGEQSVTLTGSTGGAFSAPAGLSLNATNGTVTPSTSQPADYLITYTIPAAGGCSSASATAAVSVISTINWSGNSGTNWNDPANWSCTIVPTTNLSVIIPDVANDPEIGLPDDIVVNNLTLQSGSLLNVAGTLRVTGSINTGGKLSVPGTLVMQGTSPQVIPCSVFMGDPVKNLIINNNTGVSLQEQLKVTGSIKLDNGNLASDGNLVLVSNASGTAFVYGSDTYNITGNVTMQRYLDNAYGYSYFSSPFTAAKVSEFVPEITLGGSFALIYKYDENRMYSGVPVSGWERYDVATNTLNPLNGYSLNFAANTPLTVDVTGVLNNGPLQLSVYNHNQKYTIGYNFVGNPYPSAIDWDLVSDLNPDIEDAIYLFEATDRYTGVYSSYVNGVSTGKGSNIIPSMQGFFIHVPDPVAPAVYPVTATLDIDNSVRITDTNHEFLKKSSAEYTRKGSKISAEMKSKGEIPLLKISAGFSDNSLPDPAVIYFDEKASGNFDKNLDARKFLNTSQALPNFYSYGTDNSMLSINAIPLESEHLPEIPLGIRTKRNGTVVFRIEEIQGLFPASTIYLYDAYAGTLQDITSTEQQVFLNSGNYDNRFFLRFENLTTEIKHDISLKPLNLYSSGSIIHAEVNCLEGTPGTLKLTNLTGQVLFESKIYENGHHEFDANVKSGIYVISFESRFFRRSQKVFIQ